MSYRLQTIEHISAEFRPGNPNELQIGNNVPGVMTEDFCAGLVAIARGERAELRDSWRESTFQYEAIAETVRVGVHLFPKNEFRWFALHVLQGGEQGWTTAPPQYVRDAVTGLLEQYTKTPDTPELIPRSALEELAAKFS